ncbi:hypothetical protein TREMEDRAFT_65694 [Tremella mesenterica DSM 1558]|uniref:uncharacterized protein n=1 Tax=Tremella mesenterica (strain ATCC 24925 / CBS 8224 / DSM 1558 / NBRC 9311 / NRRL Y-6157 / RJB 2259-6 / UBC 559-6) TaxID=578456 RepID=UPI00032C9F57|nr:uncharacterized protein TREMEDRAFT_65694 [Tremella mesenterica DSM 1558]EIW66405.1 hypothetical protein TREMEDRAFT_65694 [Tremella mesenterica DSM 1558]
MYPSHSSPSASSSSWSEQEQRGVSSTDTTAIDIDVDLLALLTTCIHPRFHLPSYHTISQHPTLDLEHSPLNNDLPVINQPRSKAEKQKDKKKRRKERERLRVDQGSDSRLCSYHPTGMDMVEFKLFSNVRDISLDKPLEEYPVPINPRHIPLSPSTTNRKRKIIQSSVYNPSNAPLEYTYTHQPSSSSITYRLESPIHSDKTVTKETISSTRETSDASILDAAPRDWREVIGLRVGLSFEYNNEKGIDSLTQYFHDDSSPKRISIPAYQRGPSGNTSAHTALEWQMYDCLDTRPLLKTCWFT